MPVEPLPVEIATWDAGEPIEEVLAQRASDAATYSLHVRTATQWLTLDSPTEALGVQLQQALSDPNAEARAYKVGNATGLTIRTKCISRK
jgi:hypothetical protein